MRRVSPYGLHYLFPHLGRPCLALQPTEAGAGHARFYGQDEKTLGLRRSYRPENR